MTEEENNEEKQETNPEKDESPLEESIEEVEEEPQGIQFNDFMQESSFEGITHSEAPVLKSVPIQEQQAEPLESQIKELPSSKKSEEHDVQYTNQGTAYQESNQAYSSNQENPMQRDSQIAVAPSLQSSSSGDMQSFSPGQMQSQSGGMSMRDTEQAYKESMPTFKEDKPRRGFGRR